MKRKPVHTVVHNAVHYVASKAAAKTSRWKAYRRMFVLYGIRGAGTSAGTSAIAVIVWWVRNRT